MNIRAIVGSMIGDTWASRKMLAIWPWPAVIIGTHGGAGELFTAEDYRFFTSCLKPGDFILTRSKGFFGSNSAIPGAFKHLAIYVGATTGQPQDGIILKPRLTQTVSSGGMYHARTVIHAISEGVVAQDLYTLTKHIDYAAVVRPWTAETDQQLIVNAALERVGIEYNFDFTPKGPPASYCTELGSHCLQHAKLPCVPHTRVAVGLFKRLDIPLADDFVAGYGALICSASASDPAFIRKSHHLDVMRQCMQSVPDYRDQSDASDQGPTCSPGDPK